MPTISLNIKNASIFVVISKVNFGNFWSFGISVFSGKMEMFSAEPKCPHGRALKDSYGNFVTCGAGGDPGASKGCPVSYQCQYDGKTYGCCPTQS